MNMIKSINNSLRKLGVEVKRYRRSNLKWIEDLGIKSVLDVGANIGQFALRINKILPDAKTYSFEPINSCYAELITNTKILNVQTYNYALGNKNGVTEINVSSHTPSSSLLKMAPLHKKIYAHTKDNIIAKIEVRKLDDIYKDMNIKPPILLKLDVQGYELEVLKGAREFLDQVKIVLTEINYDNLYDNQATFKDIFLLLDSYGFSFKGNLTQTANPLNGGMLYSDSIFIK